MTIVTVAEPVGDRDVFYGRPIVGHLPQTEMLHRNGGSLPKNGRRVDTLANLAQHVPLHPHNPTSFSMEWFCIHTKPKKEFQVADYCRRMLGLETYYPRLRQQKTIRGKRTQVTGPLFPRYLFCRFDPTIAYRAVRYAPDAIDIVRAGDRPAIVSPTLVDGLKGWAGEALDIVTLHPPLRCGDMVEIVSGPMRGLPAVILRISDDMDRVSILLSILQCGAQMVVNRENLQRIA